MEACFEGAPQGIFVLSLDKYFITCNKLMCQWLDSNNINLKNTKNKLSILDFIETKDLKNLFLKYFDKALKGVHASFECKFIVNNSSVLWLEIDLGKTSNDGVDIIIGIAKNITDKKKSQSHLSYHCRALDQAADSVVITNKNGIIEYVNEAFVKKTGYQRNSAIGGKPSILKSGEHSGEFYKTLWNTINNGKVFRDILKNKKKNGCYYYEEKTITPIKNEQDQITHYMSTGRDITKRLIKQHKIDYFAHHDSLTGFYNRRFLNKKLKKIILDSKNNKRISACFFIDLDDFKGINDNYGHNYGDLVLKTIAKRISSCTRHKDILTRIGGDEFFIVVPELSSIEDGKVVAKKLLESIKQKIHIENIDLSVTVSIGMVVVPEHGTNLDDVIKNADMAMYHAKELGKNSFFLYNKGDVHGKSTTEIDLLDALRKEEFLLNYQPVYDMSKNKIFYTECLIRWNHNSRVVPPFRFIPAAERLGLIQKITRWVLHEACNKQKQLKLEYDCWMPMAINLSVNSLINNDFIEELYQIVRSHNLTTDNFIIEVSDNELLKNIAFLKENLCEIHNMGFRLVLDNFGTGYMNVIDLKSMPFDFIKIDKSFLSTIPGENNEEALLTALIDMVISMNFKLIVQGVECDYHKILLNLIGCKYQQGYFLSRPISGRDLESVIMEV